MSAHANLEELTLDTTAVSRGLFLGEGEGKRQGGPKLLWKKHAVPAPPTQNKGPKKYERTQYDMIE